MQYVNDDMDDVFRRAAKNYPLDTGGADWNKVLAGLQGQETNKPEEKKDHRRFLWLLMLLPLGLVCNYYYGRDKGVIAKNNKQQSQSAGSATMENTGAYPTTQKTEKNKTSDGERAGTNGTGLPGSLLASPSKDMIVFNATGESTPVSTNSLKTNHNNKKYNVAGKNSSNLMEGSADYVSSEVNSSPEANLTSNKSSTYTGFINHGKMKLGAAAIRPSAKYSNVSNDPSIKTGLERKPQKFYLGLMGGIDKTTIESQKTSKNGFDYGMLLGYKIGRKWALEAGAFMDKKYYYTEGKYFKNDGLYMPPNSWITDVDGSCRMWDLSIGGTYSLLQNNRSGLFVATGMSSYIMKEENYDYTYYYAGSGTSAVHSKTYVNESTDLFSIVNLSIGYTHRLGKIADLRVEPYMKIPVQGVGVGNLQLFSAGIHIGVTGKLF